MPEKLSQNQIDALLAKLNSGETAEEEAAGPVQKYKEYDFRSPKKFTKEQLKAMDSLHENFSRMLSSHFSGLLRMVCEVSVLQIEEQRYYEYNNALPDSALIGLIDLEPQDNHYSDATLLMDMSTSLGYLFVDRLLGGPGTGYNMSRDFTEIEISILQNVFQKICVHLQEAWCNYIDVKVGLRDIETNSRLLQALAPDDIVVIVALNMKINSLTGNVSICIPGANLEEMINNFSNKYGRNAKQTNATVEKVQRELIGAALDESELELKAILSTLQLNVRDIMQLQVNDIIPLNQSISSDISVAVEDEVWFTAKLGECKQKKAIKLNRLAN